MVASILYTIVGAIIGGLVTFYFTRKKFEKEIKENPPINEKMIRAMFLQIVNNDKVSYDTFFLFLGCLRNESFGYIIVINKLLF